MAKADNSKYGGGLNKKKKKGGERKDERVRCARCFILQSIHSTSPVACEQPVQLVAVKVLSSYPPLPLVIFDSCVP